MHWLYLFPAILFIGSFLHNCVTTPGSNRKQLILISTPQMLDMGEKAYQDIKSKEKISADKKLTAEVAAIGRNIADASGAEFDWEFNLFDSKQINAFCLPGGKIGVYTGILKMAKNNAGLAAIIGHEVAHATARHGNERASQQLLVSGGMMALNAALEDEKKRDLIMAAIGLTAQFGVILPYSRRQESEADTIGLRFMAEAGYEPIQASKLWLRMAELAESPPEWLSTHPDPRRRAKDLRAAVNDVAKTYERSPKIPTKAL